jgi:hypothetical protein
VYWQSFFRIFPFTQEREDSRAALVAWSLTNAINRLYEITLARYAGKKSFRFEPLDLLDFLPDYLKQRKPKTAADPLQRAEYQAFKEKLMANRPQEM